MMFQKTKGWDTLSGSALAFLIFRIFFKISLRVLAGRAKLRRFFTLYHISAVEAYPSRLRRLRGKHLAVPNLVEIFNESFAYTLSGSDLKVGKYSMKYSYDGEEFVINGDGSFLNDLARDGSFDDITSAVFRFKKQ